MRDAGFFTRSSTSRPAQPSPLPRFPFSLPSFAFAVRSLPSPLALGSRCRWCSRWHRCSRWHWRSRWRRTTSVCVRVRVAAVSVGVAGRVAVGVGAGRAVVARVVALVDRTRFAHGWSVAVCLRWQRGGRLRCPVIRGSRRGVAARRCQRAVRGTSTVGTVGGSQSAPVRGCSRGWSAHASIGGARHQSGSGSPLPTDWRHPSSRDGTHRWARWFGRVGSGSSPLLGRVGVLPTRDSGGPVENGLHRLGQDPGSCRCACRQDCESRDHGYLRGA